MSALAVDVPPPGKRERTKAANRAAILDAAREVFAEIGYDAATVRDVVRRTPLASGTFYNYFPDKEAVLRALVDEHALEARARVRAARREATTVEAFVAGGFQAFFAFLVSDRAAFRLMRRNAGTIRALFGEPVLGAGADELEEDLREAVADGRLPAVDAHLMAGAMVAAAFEVGVRMLDAPRPDVPAAVRFCTALFVGGIERLGEGRG